MEVITAKSDQERNGTKQMNKTVNTVGSLSKNKKEKGASAPEESPPGDAALSTEESAATATAKE